MHQQFPALIYGPQSDHSRWLIHGAVGCKLTLAPRGARWQPLNVTLIRQVRREKPTGVGRFERLGRGDGYYAKASKHRNVAPIRYLPSL